MISELKQLGLTEYESKVYAALLNLKTATGGELTKSSGVPHGKTYEALHRLAGRGLVTILPVEPKIFKILDPRAALKALVQKKSGQLEETKKAVLQEIQKVKAPAKKEAVEKLEIYSGVNMQYSIAGQMIDVATRQLFIISKGEPVPSSILRKIQQNIKKGVDHRLIVYDPTNKEWLRKFKDAGLKLRYFKTGEFTLVVRDQKEVLLVIRSPEDPKDRVVSFFKDEAIAKAMTTYFETVWKKASEVRV